MMEEKLRRALTAAIVGFYIDMINVYLPLVFLYSKYCIVMSSS